MFRVTFSTVKTQTDLVVHLCYVGKVWLGCVVFPPLMHKMKLISIGFAKCCNRGDCVQTSGAVTFEGSCGPQWCVLQRTEGQAEPAPFPQSDCLALCKKIKRNKCCFSVEFTVWVVTFRPIGNGHLVV